jgi:hypothetical protein
MPFTNTYGAVWEAGIGGVTLPTPPLDLRITNTIGQQVGPDVMASSPPSMQA